MDDEKLVYEVEKYKELYNPQNRYYKDMTKREIIWEAVGAALGASPDDCKRRWKQLRDAYVKHKGKKTASGSAGGSQKEWRLAYLFSFIDPYLQPRSTKSTLQPEGLREENIEAGDEEMGGSSPQSLQGSRPCTPTPLTRPSSPFQSGSGQRSATTTPQVTRSDTPPPHPRVQELSSDTQQRKRRRQGREYASAAVGVEQQLFQILTADKPIPSNTPPPLPLPSTADNHIQNNNLFPMEMVGTVQAQFINKMMENTMLPSSFIDGMDPQPPSLSSEPAQQQVESQDSPSLHNSTHWE
ncbi:uncharacterized protein LOC125905717 [Xyrichtys novacula]|uniref:Uncharacterized protein LOC125905717 n=1 Tax=Xyrichtys novacula TaxID=13765 RepID=A0AAV1GPH0_XYRNO|nr:uncharacterized protein LOC125905717 [Xyrichtys novacula]